MSTNITLFYRRVGAWPATTPEAFEVTCVCPNPNLQYVVHGEYEDFEPGGRQIWTTLSIPEDRDAGLLQLRMKLALDGPLASIRFGNLIGDSISLLRACCRALGWSDHVDAERWLSSFAPHARLQRAAILRSCL